MKKEDLTFLEMMGTSSKISSVTASNNQAMAKNKSKHTKRELVLEEEQQRRIEKIEKKTAKAANVKITNGSRRKKSNNTKKTSQSINNLKSESSLKPAKTVLGISSKSDIVSGSNSRNGNHNGNSIVNHPTATKSVEETTKRKRLYLTHRFIIFLLGLYIFSRLSMSVFCHFDDSQQSYIIIQLHQNDMTKEKNTCTTTSSDLKSQNGIQQWNDTYRKHKEFISQQLCQSSHSYLDYMTLIIQPYIPYEYRAVIPKVSIKKQWGDSNCSGQTWTSTSNNEENHLLQQKVKKSRNPIKKIINAFQSVVRKVLHVLFKKKIDDRRNNESITTGTSHTNTIGQDSNANSGKKSNNDSDDWTILVSAPLELNLSSQQSEVLIRTGKNFLERLDKEQQKYQSTSSSKGQNRSNDGSTTRLKDMFWGGDEAKSGGSASFPWWFPKGAKFVKDDINNDGSSGTRLLESYLKIMHWPQNLITNFPYSNLCTDGCPTDFALVHTLEFREKFKPWAMTPSAFETSKIGWAYVRGYSPSRYTTSVQGGSSVLWYRPGLGKIPDNKYEEFTRIMIQGVETCVADALHRSGGKVGKCNIVLDAKGFGLSFIPSMGATKKLLTMMKDHFPSRLGVFVIANAARPAQIMLNLVLPFLSADVRRKIHLLPSNEEERSKLLSSLVEDEYIPVWLGGNDRYVFDAEEYYKSGKFKTEFISDEAGLDYLKTMPYHA